MSTFPQPFTSSTSHWQATNRGPSSLNQHNATGPPPSDADIVIVGGGTMGASLAYMLTREGAAGEGKRVVLLEGKDVGSGASGRNGGHLGPYGSEGWYHLTQPLQDGGAGLSEKEAVHVIQKEMDNFDLIDEILEREGLKGEVDFWRGELCETQETEQGAKESLRNLLAWEAARTKHGLTTPSGSRYISDPTQLKKESRFAKIHSCILRPAGSIHSHKLCTALMRLAINSPHSSFTLCSWAPVLSVTEGEKGGWELDTPKGRVRAGRVVLCTNAHTGTFFPKDDLMHTHILPRFIMSSLITPPPTFSGPHSLTHTYNSDDGHYLIQTPRGEIVLGGGEELLVDKGMMERDWNDGGVDDSYVVPEHADHLAKYCRQHFDGWGKEALGEGMQRVWSGIITKVKDVVPVVGEVPGREGWFIAAGFGGHGQSRIFTVAQGLAHLLLTSQWDESLLPRSFELTTARLERGRELLKHLPRERVLRYKDGREVNGRKGEGGWGCVVA